MKKIMVNECLMHLRASNSYLIIVTDEFPDTPVAEEITPAISVKKMYEYITELPDGFRTVFNLFVIEKRTHVEIARLLGISKSTSQSQLARARNILQQIIIKNDKEYETRIHK